MANSENTPEDVLSEFEVSSSAISERKSYSGTLYGVFIFIVGLFNIVRGKFINLQFIIGIVLIVIAILLFYKTNKAHKQ